MRLVEVVCVDDFVAVTLLGEEALAVLGEVLVHGVTCNKRVEIRRAAIGRRVSRTRMAAETFDCVRGVDLTRFCQACADLVDQMTREYDMQTSGTFPQLMRKDSVTRPAKGGGRVGKGEKGKSGKGGKGKGC